MKHIINKLGFLFIFLENLYLPFDLGFDFRFNYLLYALFILFYLITHNKLRVSVKFLSSFFIVLALFFLVPLLKEGNISGFIRQAILISYQIIFSYLLLNSYGFDYKKILKDYLSITYLIGFVAIVQLILIKIGFVNLASFSYLGFDLGNFVSSSGDRIQSWFEEPSFLAYAIMPATFIALSRIFKLHTIIPFWKAVFILVITLSMRTKATTQKYIQNK